MVVEKEQYYSLETVNCKDVGLLSDIKRSDFNTSLIKKPG